MKILRVFGDNTNTKDIDKAVFLRGAFKILGQEFHIFEIKDKIKYQNYDILHLSGRFSYLKLFKLYNPKSKHKLIYEITGANLIKNSGKFKLKSILDRFEDRSTRSLISKAQILLISSELDVDKDLINVKGEIEIIRSGIDVNRYRKIPGRQLAFNYNVICPNSIEKDSDIPCLIETLKYLPDNTCLFMTGEIPDSSYYNEMIDIIKNIRLENRIIFRSMDEISDILPSISVGITIYRGDIIKSGAIELLLTGIPVITNVDYSLDVKGLQYFKTDSGKSFAKSIKDYVGMGEFYVDISKVRKLFSWETKAKEMIQIYQGLKSGNNT
jgi:glycosyltransferase involved in cell wall biosynthesis